MHSHVLNEQRRVSSAGIRLLNQMLATMVRTAVDDRDLGLALKKCGVERRPLTISARGSASESLSKSAFWGFGHIH